MDFVNEKLEEFNKFLDGKKVAIIGMGVSNVPLLDYFYLNMILILKNLIIQSL